MGGGIERGILEAYEQRNLALKSPVWMFRVKIFGGLQPCLRFFVELACHLPSFLLVHVDDA